MSDGLAEYDDPYESGDSGQECAVDAEEARVEIAVELDGEVGIDTLKAMRQIVDS